MTKRRRILCGRRTTRDFIADAPDELAISVLEWLDVCELCASVCRVSKAWHSAVVKHAQRCQQLILVKVVFAPESIGVIFVHASPYSSVYDSYAYDNIKNHYASLVVHCRRRAMLRAAPLLRNPALLRHVPPENRRGFEMAILFQALVPLYPGRVGLRPQDGLLELDYERVLFRPRRTSIVAHLQRNIEELVLHHVQLTATTLHRLHTYFPRLNKIRLQTSTEGLHDIVLNLASVRTSVFTNIPQFMLRLAPQTNARSSGVARQLFRICRLCQRRHSTTPATPTKGWMIDIVSLVSVQFLYIDLSVRCAQSQSLSLLLDRMVNLQVLWTAGAAFNLTDGDTDGDGVAARLYPCLRALILEDVPHVSDNGLVTCLKSLLRYAPCLTHMAYRNTARDIDDRDDTQRDIGTDGRQPYLWYEALRADNNSRRRCRQARPYLQVDLRGTVPGSWFPSRIKAQYTDMVWYNRPWVYDQKPKTVLGNNWIQTSSYRRPSRRPECPDDDAMWNWSSLCNNSATSFCKCTR